MSAPKLNAGSAAAGSVLPWFCEMTAGWFWGWCATWNRGRAKPGAITLVAESAGGAALTFQDRRTNIVTRMFLDTDNRVWLQFSDFTSSSAAVRPLGLSGDACLTTPP
jgi:hypothetical protein